MKSQVNSAAVVGLLGEQVLHAVLADQLDAGLRQRGQITGLDVLGGGEDLDLRADSLAHPVEVSLQLFNTHSPAWRPVTPSSRRWEK